jgi:L-amino acid N-acyltransferase YncA
MQMPSKFILIPFAKCNLKDRFFDSLKQDYTEFSDWFSKKANAGETAYVFQDESNHIHAFMYLKDETDKIPLLKSSLPVARRLKIGTLKLSESILGQRLGEGALGMALWRWRESNVDQIYLTVFSHHESLIDLVTKFGFKEIGQNPRRELVFMKDKRSLDTSDPFKSFPYLLPNFEKACYIPVNDYYHDTLFPYSELHRTNQEAEEIAAANGITKVFLGFPTSNLPHEHGDPVIIYRIYTGTTGSKTYKSVATSFCTVTKVLPVKISNSQMISQEEFLTHAANKTVFTMEELQGFYSTKKNLILIEMVYNGFFGKGHNITHRDLTDAGLFDGYPYTIRLTPEEFAQILEMGGKNAADLIAD